MIWGPQGTPLKKHIAGQYGHSQLEMKMSAEVLLPQRGPSSGVPDSPSASFTPPTSTDQQTPQEAGG